MLGIIIYRLLTNIRAFNKTVILSTLLFNYTHTIAQDSLTHKVIFIHTTPTTLFDPLTRIRIGSDYETSYKTSIGCNIGIGWQNILNDELKKKRNSTDYHFNEFRLEFKNYLYPYEKLSSYIAIEAYYIRQTEHIKNDFYIEDKLRYDFSSAHYERLKTGFNIKHGAKCIFGKFVYLDFYYGFGLTIRKVTYSETEGVTEPTDMEYLLGIEPPRYNKVGRNLYPQLALGIRIGVAIQTKSVYSSHE